jgi:hypothetical protein
LAISGPTPHSWRRLGGQPVQLGIHSCHFGFEGLIALTQLAQG